MQAADRLLEIVEKYGSKVLRIVPVELDESSLRVVIYLKDGSNLRVAEQWDGAILKRYSYYWLTSKNKLKIGWDNAPHHTQTVSFPHHKHVNKQKHLQPSEERCLEEVIKVVLSERDSCPAT